MKLSRERLFLVLCGVIFASWLAVGCGVGKGVKDRRDAGSPTPSVTSQTAPPTTPQVVSRGEITGPDEIPASLPPPNLRFDRITREDGLSSNTVSCILQDDLGFLWVGTQDGLNRYDGHSFTVYRHDPDDPFSLRDDFIESIYEDRSGVLWIGTQDGWLERYDRQNDQFVHYVVGSHVLAMYEDTAGDFWIGTQDPGLFRFERDTEEAVLVWRGRNFTSIIEDQAGVVWVASPEEGVGRYNRASDRFSTLKVSYPAHTIVEDQAGELWIATWGGGLGRFDRETEQFSYFRNTANDPNSLSNDYVSSLYEDRSGMLWVGTQQPGLDRLDQESASGVGRFAHYQNDPSTPHSLGTNSITTIYEDRSSALWIGHEVGGGISKLAPGAEQFGHYRYIPGDTNNLTIGAVTSLFEDQKGVLWVGTFSGLGQWDRKTGGWNSYRHDPDDPDSLAHDSVRSVYADRSNVVWIGTEGGLNRYDREQDRFVYIGTPVVMWMHEGPSGIFWLATKNGLFQLNRETDELVLIREGYAWKIMILEDRSGVVWVGSSGDGLDRYDPASGVWRHFENDPDDPHSLSNDSVETIHEDESGTLWFGTRGGLNRFDRETETFVHYRVRDGLPHDAVVGILEDSNGSLWLSTGGGLSRFDPGTESFKNYYARDGLQGESFWRNAYHQNSSDEMFFGGENGLNVFRPDQVTDNPHPPPIIITAFSLFNQVERTNLQTNEQIELNYQDNFVSFDFAALDFHNPEKNQYAYKMEGIDKDWVNSSTRRHVDYPNLPPGEYVFRVKGSNNDGVWNEEGIAVRITIKPPFWGTWWFRGGVLVALLGVAVGAYRLRVRSVEARSRELETQVRERTAELQQEIEQRLQIEEALRESEREKAVAEERGRLARELHDAVTQTLFSASLIAEVLPRIWEMNQERGRQQLEEVRTLTRGALAEMRTLLLELRPEALTKAKMADLLRQLGRAMMGRTGVQVEVSIAGETTFPSSVQIALYRIAQEALNNAAKHADASKVEVSLRCITDDGRPTTDSTLAGISVELCVRDDGRGFDPNEVPADRLGLGIMRERAEAIGARLEVESAPGEGTRVVVAWKMDDGRWPNDDRRRR